MDDELEGIKSHRHDDHDNKDLQFSVAAESGLCKTYIDMEWLPSQDTRSLNTNWANMTRTFICLDLEYQEDD